MVHANLLAVGVEAGQVGPGQGEKPARDGASAGDVAGDREQTGSFHVLNIGCGDRFTLLEVVASLNEIMGTDVETEHAEGRPGDVRHSHAAIDRAREVLGYKPLVDFKEGLRRTVAFYTGSPELLNFV